MKKEAYIYLLALILHVIGQSCPPGWVDGPLGKKCYLFAKNHNRNWNEAQYICQSMRAELLAIEDATEMRWIRQELTQIKTPSPGKELEWWTSLNNQKNISSWVWANDVPLNETVIRWGSGEPNNHLNQERCGEICCPYFFNDKSCETSINYICELNKETPLTCDADNGWEYHRGSCFKFVRKYRSWNDSVSDCRNSDAMLATITDSDSQIFITMMANFQQADSWIGLTKSNQTYFYTNSSKATGIENYLQTGKTPLNMGKVTCMSVDGTATDHAKNVYEDDCTISKQYICVKPEGICKAGMLQHQSSCYYVSATAMNRRLSETFCSVLKMSLVDIDSKSESDYLMSVLQKQLDLNEIWIGLKKTGNDWYWSSTGERPTLDYWADLPSEKNESINDCAYLNIRDGGKWHNNFPCDSKLKFVCESPVITSFATTTVPITTTVSTTELTTTSSRTTESGVQMMTTVAPCNVELCEDLFQQSKAIESHSDVLSEAAKKYSEPPSCISWRTRLNCLKLQAKQCLQHFQYNTQVNGIQFTMDQLLCSNNTSAAVFNASTMVQQCRKNVMGLDYRGKISTTSTGRTCQAWSSISPHRHNFQQELLTESNYCRNPDKEPGGPWCYTMDVNQRWEYCDIPYCVGVPTPPTTTGLTTVPTPIIFPTTTITWSEKCGLFWEEGLSTSDICYHFDEQLVSWMTARQKCKELDGELVSITSPTDQSYLAGRLRNSLLSAVWIGANSRGQEEGWRWSDESPFSFLHWTPDQPDGIDNNENCVSMDTEIGTWDDRQCDDQLGFVCQKSVAEPTTPPLPPKSPVVGKDQMYDCQEGWVSYRSNCYFVNRTKSTWQEARRFCQLNGAELTSIGEEGEHDFITSQLPSKFCYNIHHNDSACDKWSAQGECDKNPVWMAKNCHLSCNLCIRDCKNLHYSVECDHWANLGECEKNHQWMLTNCPLSCGICDGAIYGGFWIGLNDRSFQMSFKWSDESKVTYTKWAKGEPNNWFDGQTKEDCIIMLLKDGYWNDVSCGMQNPGFICKKRKEVLVKVTESPLSVGCVNNTIGYDAYCYGINDEKVNWTTAENICSRSTYGHLATINDRYVQAFLSSQLVGKTDSFWIGLTQDRSSGAMESWSNGLPVLFTHWAKSHTGSIDEDSMCVSMTSSHPVGLWETKNCSLPRSYICEYPRTGYTTSTTTTTTTLPPSCPNLWMEFGNYCYKRMAKTMTWMKGRDYCRLRGADLPSIHSDQEDRFLKNLMGYNTYEIWIGLNDRDSENGYVWSDGSPADFLVWNPGEPNDKYDQEDCVERSRYSQGWNDDNCYKTKNVFCKIMKGMPLLEPNDTFTEEYCDAEKKWLYFNDFCYFIQQYQSLNYKDARQQCLDKNSDLLSVHSQHESNWLLEMINQKSDMWIGLNSLDRYLEGYRWSDYSAYDFVHWETNKPSFPLSNKCVKIVSSTGRWHDVNCFMKVPGYICKRKNDTSAHPGTPPPLPPLPGGCMPGFTKSTFNEKCYQLFKIKKDWNEAERTCQAFGKGYNLVSIETELEQLFISSLLVNVDEKVWMGLTDEQSYRKFYWTDHTDLVYTNWHPIEPSTYSEHCGDIFVSREKFGQWNDERCSMELYYMCEGFQNPSLPETPPGSSDCPNGYTLYDSMCFKFYETPSDWNTSLTACQIDGGSLTSIHNSMVKLFIQYLTYNKTSLPFWIGLYRMNPEDIEYKWINRWPLVYTNWNPNKLSPTKSCIASDSDFWTDQSCDVKLPYVCQINKNLPPPTSEPGHCKSDGYIHKEKCYYPFIHYPETWTVARDKCSKMGLQLVSISGLDDTEFIINLYLKLTGTRDKLWIGLNRLDRYAYLWTWTDNSPATFQNWEPGEPSSQWNREHDNELCVEMRPSGQWNDMPCLNYKRPYFCIGDKVTEEILTTEPTVQTTKQTIQVETMEQSMPKSTNPTTALNVNPEANKDITSSKIDSRIYTSITTVQIVGIVIGIIGCIVIVAAILFVIRFLKQKGTYNTNSHSFSNALYLKTTETINEDDPNEMGSTVKICET